MSEKLIKVGDYSGVSNDLNVFETPVAKLSVTTTETYRADIEVRLVNYPDGKVLAKNSFKGANPPYNYSDSSYGVGERAGKER